MNVYNITYCKSIQKHNPYLGKEQWRKPWTIKY